MTIPASAFVQVVPSVLSAGSPPISMSGLFVTNDTSIPIGTVQSFGNAAAVSSWFGPSSNQAALANVYFSGYSGATSLPGNLLFVQYNTAAVDAYVRGGSLAAMTLSELQALSGTISININGTAYTTASINLSSATSFANAATIIQTALTTAGAACTVTWDTLRTAFVIATTTSGTAGSVAFPTDSSLSPSLLLTAAKGAVQSAGAAANTPAGVMNTVIGVTTDWASFSTDYLPDLTDMEGFATWVNGQNSRFLYVPYDDDAAALSPNASGIIGTITASYDGVCCIYNPSGLVAAFIMGAIASINFSATGGRITFAYRAQTGLTPDITSLTQYQALIGNHYNAYVAVASATQAFQFFQNGQVSGTWEWLDSYVNEIYFNNALQSAWLQLLASTNAIPFTRSGQSMLANALQPTINQMLAFGAAVAGGELSGTQASEVNAACGGLNAAQSIENYGYFLYLPIPNTTVQQARGPWPGTLFYFDGQSVQTLTLGSVDVG